MELTKKLEPGNTIKCTFQIQHDGDTPTKSVCGNPLQLWHVVSVSVRHVTAVQLCNAAPPYRLHPASNAGASRPTVAMAAFGYWRQHWHTGLEVLPRLCRWGPGALWGANYMVMMEVFEVCPTISSIHPFNIVVYMVVWYSTSGPKCYAKWVQGQCFEIARLCQGQMGVLRHDSKESGSRLFPIQKS